VRPRAEPAGDSASPPTPAASVYVHAPFCARRCFYCDFAVSVRRSGGAAEWLEALSAELALLEGEGLFALADPLDTLYVGGGTPSLLGPDAMSGLVDVLGRNRLGASNLEWTAEANPESLTPEVAAAWKGAGVNRISLGLQTFHEPALRWMGRLHGAEKPVASVRSVRDAGIDNVSVDLIFGLPETLGRSWDEDLRRVLDLGVPHVSLYGLTVEAGTPLGRAVREGRESAVDEEQYRREFLRAADVLGAAGYQHYEVSNFALPGFRSRHNAVYWQGGAYLGLGNGAHAYAPPVRRWNQREWTAYQAAVLAGVSPEAEREHLTAQAARLERLWLGLRTAEGVPTRSLPERAGLLLDRWVGAGLAARAGDTIRLTTEGWLLLDELTVELDEALGTATHGGGGPCAA
jgi:oxygen-independent coproporphyrinogen-3 oxidase